MQRYRFLVLAIGLLFVLVEPGRALVEAIPAIRVTIHYKAGGAVHVFRAVYLAATEGGLNCTPSVGEVDRGFIIHDHGKAFTEHARMICTRPSFGTVRSVAINYALPGEITVSADYDPNVPRLSVRGVIDGIIDRIETDLKSDPLIPAIDHTENFDSHAVVSKIK